MISIGDFVDSSKYFASILWELCQSILQQKSSMIKQFKEVQRILGLTNTTDMI